MVRKGQSTIEYLLLLTAVMTAVIFFVMRFNANPNPSFATKLNQIYTAGADSVVDSSSTFFSSVNNYTITGTTFGN